MEAILVVSYSCGHIQSIPWTLLTLLSTTLSSRFKKRSWAIWGGKEQIGQGHRIKRKTGWKEINGFEPVGNDLPESSGLGPMVWTNPLWRSPSSTRPTYVLIAGVFFRKQ